MLNHLFHRQDAPDIRSIHAILHIEDRLNIQADAQKKQQWDYYKGQFLSKYPAPPVPQPMQPATGYAQPAYGAPPVYSAAPAYTQQPYAQPQQPFAQQPYAQQPGVPQVAAVAGQQGVPQVGYAQPTTAAPQYNQQAYASANSAQMAANAPRAVAQPAPGTQTPRPPGPAPSSLNPIVRTATTPAQ